MDVMLVLLIIFIITAPLMSHKVKVDLPEANLIQKPEDAEKRAGPITLAVKEDGSIYWNDEEINKQTLESRLATAAQQTPQPPLNLRGDRTTKMRVINDLTKVAQEQGMLDVGFVATKEKGQ
ncbi:biopolymer transport ExbD1 protein [Stenotrophomonas sp. SKA14]|nr:biopolymer transport ExbD1 protein [Stenotrophomonas sp. SKA14]